MVCQTVALTAWLPFLTPPRLGGVAVVVCVECVVPFGGLVVELAPGGQDGCGVCAYGVCGLRAAR